MLDLKAACWGPPSKNLALEVLQDMESSRTEAEASRVSSQACFSCCSLLLELINNQKLKAARERKKKKIPNKKGQMFFKTWPFYSQKKIRFQEASTCSTAVLEVC